MTTISRERRPVSPVIVSQGFRPFFLLAGLWAVVALPLWLAVFAGWIVVPTAFDPVAWHVHEMLFGYVGAVLAGFILTAVPNWTGRIPVRGAPLVALAGAWVAGPLVGPTTDNSNRPSPPSRATGHRCFDRGLCALRLPARSRPSTSRTISFAGS